MPRSTPDVSHMAVDMPKTRIFSTNFAKESRDKLRYEFSSFVRIAVCVRIEEAMSG